MHMIAADKSIKERKLVEFKIKNKKKKERKKKGMKKAEGEIVGKQNKCLLMA